MSTTKSMDAQLEAIKSKLLRDMKDAMANDLAKKVIDEETNVIDTYVYQRPFERKIYDKVQRGRDGGLLDKRNYETELNEQGNVLELSVTNITQANPDLYFKKDNGEIYKYTSRNSVNEGKLLLPIIEEGNDAYGDFPNAEGIWKDPVPIRELTLQNMAQNGTIKKTIVGALKNKGWNID